VIRSSCDRSLVASTIVHNMLLVSQPTASHRRLEVRTCSAPNDNTRPTGPPARFSRTWHCPRDSPPYRRWETQPGTGG
jgi:hypothetical protein